MQLTSNQKTIMAWTAILVLLVSLLWFFAPVLAPFGAALVFAYALTPMVNRLSGGSRVRLPRVLAVVIVEVVFLLALLAVVLLIVPILAKEVPMMRDQLPLLLVRLNDVVSPMLAQLGINVSIDVESVKAFALKYFSSNAEETLGSTLRSLKLGSSVAFSIIGDVVLIPVVLFYLLMDWDGFVNAIRSLVPPKMRPAVQSFAAEADSVLGQYLRGQLLVMFLLAIYYSLGLTLFGLDLAIPIGVFTGLAIFVPYLGFGLGLFLATLAGLLQFAQTPGVGHAVVMISVVYGCGQVLEGFFLTPRLVGERIGLHPVAVIFALLAFGQALGFVGVLVALPASAVLLVAIRRLRNTYQSSSLYQGKE